MIDYKCIACGSSWSTQNTIDQCPFCGNSLNCHSEETTAFDSMEALISYLPKHFETSLLSNRRSALGIMMDLAPNLSREIKLFGLAYDSKAINSLLHVQNADDAQWLIQTRKAYNLLIEDFYLSDKNAQLVVSWLTILLGKTNPPQPTDNTQEKSESTKSSHTVSNSAANAQQKIKLGATIEIGRYLQNSETNLEPISWYVLDIADNKALLMSKYCVDAQKYNYGVDGTTWASCALRKWLHDEFLNNAFNNRERAAIVLTHNQNEGNSRYKVPGGHSTDDKVFLLSYSEALKYLQRRDNAVLATKHAQKKGAASDRDNGGVWWWLRSPGSSSDRVAMVYPGNKEISGVGSNAYHVGGVRPVMWVSLDYLNTLI